MTENTVPGQMHFGLWKNYQLLVRKVIDIFCCPFCCLQEGLPKYNHAFLSKTAAKISCLGNASKQKYCFQSQNFIITLTALRSVICKPNPSHPIWAGFSLLIDCYLAEILSAEILSACHLLI